MENDLIIARFNKFLDQKLKGNHGTETAAGSAADYEALLQVAELLRQADYSGNSRIRDTLWLKMLETLERESGDGALDEDELYQATGGVNPTPEEEPDHNKPS